MGFLSGLAKIGSAVLPFVPVPGAGALGKILGTAAKVAPALGAVAGSRQQGREAEASAQMLQDRNRLAAEQLNLQAPGIRANQSVRGDILANAKDFAFSPTIGGGSTGGLRPSIFSNNTRQLGQQLSADALKGQMTNGGRAFTPTPLPQAGTMDSILNNAAQFSGILGAVAPAIPYTRKPRPEYTAQGPYPEELYG